MALGEAMLSVSDHLRGLHVPWHCVQEDLFHDLTKHRAEAPCSAVPQVLLATLVPNGRGVSLFPVTDDRIRNLQKVQDANAGEHRAKFYASWDCLAY